MKGIVLRWHGDEGLIRGGDKKIYKVRSEGLYRPDGVSYARLYKSEIVEFVPIYKRGSRPRAIAVTNYRLEHGLDDKGKSYMINQE